mmetsp:Transcript_50387/g.146214  ORF Transcript_50387/g.146214 Transcript_50387/m.146214 type:complete len:159 (+) Transcript_50387:1270-1746(+)
MPAWLVAAKDLPGTSGPPTATEAPPTMPGTGGDGPVAGGGTEPRFGLDPGARQPEPCGEAETRPLFGGGTAGADRSICEMDLDGTRSSAGSVAGGGGITAGGGALDAAGMEALPRVTLFRIGECDMCCHEPVPTVGVAEPCGALFSRSGIAALPWLCG